jgi:hypothetical protein
MPENWIIGTCQCQDTHIGPGNTFWIGVTWHSPNCGLTEREKDAEV